MTSATALACTLVPASANYGIGGSTVGCEAGAAALAFHGNCVALEAPTAPTQPAVGHHWSTQQPVAALACAPYTTTEWAKAYTTGGGGPNGSIGVVDGQRIPVIYSTPRTDWGWVFAVSCGTPGVVRFTGIVAEARAPSPCAPGTKAAACLPGFSPAEFMAAVEGQVPAETISASPDSLGVVGVPVATVLTPVPVTKYAQINLAVPDLGDEDPGEVLHVVWVVEATPNAGFWSWPDGTTSASGHWIPQTYVDEGTLRATVSYTVTAAGFWSDGVAVHDLPRVSVGTIPVGAELGYSVEQVQPGLG